MGFHLMDPDEFEAPQSPEQTPPSPNYVPGLEYPKGGPKGGSADYTADGGDDDDEEEESFEDDDDKDEGKASKEEEHLASVDSAALPVIDPVPSAEETKPFETNEPAATPPPPPQTIALVSMTRFHRAQIFDRPHTPPSPSTKALIAEYASTPTPSLPPPSLLSPLSSPLPRIPSPPLLLLDLHTSPTYTSAPLGYRAAMVQLRVASPSTYHLLPPSEIPSPILHVPSTPLLLPSVDLGISGSYHSTRGSDQSIAERCQCAVEEEDRRW
nr:hypothetical protein [Tanacetum cinerariifolium]